MRFDVILQKRECVCVRERERERASERERERERERPLIGAHRLSGSGIIEQERLLYLTRVDRLFSS